MDSQLPCVVKKCTALATTNERCAVHQHFDKQPSTFFCNRCGRAIKAHTWHVLTADGRQHHPPCDGKKRG